MAVHPDIDYAVVDTGDERLILAAAAVEGYRTELGDAPVVAHVPGADLADLRYRPLFDYFADQDNAFRVLAADFVTTEEGTGIVHLAPGFGEDDQRVGEEAGIGVVVPVDDQGRFTAEVPDWAGENVFDANPAIVRRLRDDGPLFRHDSYEHNYPHCWRTDTPIIYRAVDSWYVRVTDFRDRLVELNQEINWIPEHVRDGQFGRWLEGARDWSISRNRFWGSPIPIWVSDDPAYPRTDVYGSLDELEADFGVRPDDLHRPTVDELTRPNPDDPTGRSTMRRVPEVLDCWFDSGSMPYAQIHYPFENREWFEDHFPADFIVEYIAQTRGWFYTLHVLSTALFDRPPFQNVICHGVVLDEEGRKLSKRLDNYPDPELVFARHGADAMRWFLMASPILRGLNLRIDREGAGFAEVVRSTLNPIWNAFHFFTLYANADGYRAERRTDAQHVLDRYILAKTGELVRDTGDRLDAYDLAGACEVVSSFIDALNNWYIRRSRERFWAPAEPGATSRDAYDTLYTVLVTLCEVAAPLLPLLTDEIHHSLTGGPSVHLADWPDASDFPDDPALVAGMDRIRQAASAALSLREENGIRVRQPLADLAIAGPDLDELEPHFELLADEVNVRAVTRRDDVEQMASFVLKPIGAVVGPRLGGDTQAVMAAARAGEWQRSADGSVEVAGHRLTADQYELAVRTAEGAAATALPDGETVVALDTEIDADLEREGQARDLVRSLQQARKDTGLAVTDRIRLVVEVPETLSAALDEHREYIAGQVLATELTTGTVSDSATAKDLDVGGETVSVSITPV